MSVGVLMIWATLFAQADASSGVVRPEPVFESGPLGGEAYRIVDMVVADVDGAVVTYSELLSEANLVLLRLRGAEVARSARLHRGLLRVVLESMVNRELLLGEIRRLQMRPVAGGEVDELVVELRRRFDDEAGWQGFLVRAGYRGPSDPELTVPEPLRARLRAEAQIEEFLDVRIRFNIVVTERDIAECYRVHRALFGGASLQLVGPQIRRQIYAQREAKALEELIEQLRARAKTRIDPEFAPQPRPSKREPARAPGSGFTCPDETPSTRAK